MPFISINKAEFYYELHGAGKPLVLIAGYTGDHSFWNLMLESLAAKFQVLVFDNRAIGQTKDEGTPFTLEMMADDVMQLINHLGLNKPHVLGQSMGGAIAQILAKKYADSIDKLILLNTVAEFNTRTMCVLDSLLQARQEDLSFDLFVALAMPWFFASSYLADRNNMDQFKVFLQNNPYPQSIANQQRQLNALSSFNSKEWIKGITLDTLVIAAEEDIITLPIETQELADLLPMAKFTRIPGAHSSPIEQAQTLNQLLLEFLH